MIELEHVADLTVWVGQPIEIGKTAAGERRVIPILEGEVSGPRLQGRVLPAGADYQLIRADGVAELHARYVIETTAGSRIYVENSGLRHGPAEAMERLRRGEPVDPALIYFRTTTKFETHDEAFAWLARHIFVGSGVRHPDRVQIAIYQVT
jgi:hypothetical protein